MQAGDEPSGAPATSTGSAGGNLFLGTAAFMLCFYAWSMMAPFMKGFQQQLDLSYTETTLLMAAPVVLGSLARIVMGVITDRQGGHRTFSALMAFAAIPAFLFGHADAYWSLFGVGLLLGMAGASFAVGVPFVSGWAKPARRGLVLGVFGMGNIGTAVALFSAPAIATRWGRDTLGTIVAVVLLVAAALFWMLARDAPQRGPVPRYRDTLSAGWRLHRLSFFYAITFGGFVSMAFLLPTVLQDWFDFTPAQAAARAAGFTIVATLMRPIGGWLSDVIGGGYPVLVLALAGIAADATALAATANTPLIVPVTVACLTMGAFLGIGNGAVFKIVANEFPRDTGAASGIVGAAGGLGGFFPPIFVGITRDIEGSYTYGFVGLLICVALCLVTAVWLLSQVPAQQLRGEVTLRE